MPGQLGDEIPGAVQNAMNGQVKVFFIHEEYSRLMRRDPNAKSQSGWVTLIETVKGCGNSSK